MALLTAQPTTIAGSVITYTAAAGGGDTFAVNDHGTFIVRNGGGSPITVTIAVPGNTKYGLAAPDVTKSVTAGADFQFGTFPADLADPADFLVHVTYSGVTTVTVAYISH